jgi:hypothetical protein
MQSRSREQNIHRRRGWMSEHVHEARERSPVQQNQLHCARQGRGRRRLSGIDGHRRARPTANNVWT